MWAAGAMYHEISVVSGFIVLLSVALALYDIIKDN